MLKVKDVMASPVMTVTPDTSVRAAAAILSEKSVSGLPVIDGERVVGIFSEEDVLRSIQTSRKDLRMIYPSISSLGIAFQEEVTQREILDAYEEVGRRPVKEVMNTNVISVGPDITVNEAIHTMVKFGINRLPVIDKSKLIGIITRADVIRGVAREGQNSKTP